MQIVNQNKNSVLNRTEKNKSVSTEKKIKKSCVMKTFELLLSKSYKIKIKAENKNASKEFSQFYTSDILDLSNQKEREKYKFSFEDIDCTMNEVFEIREINENN